MDFYGWLQLVLFFGLLLGLTKPVGLYLVRVLDPAGRTVLDPLLKPLERLLYRLLGIDPLGEQDWKHYAASLLMFSLAGTLFTYLILRLQAFLPLNPQRFGALSPSLAFNTAVSFATNTNWQNYSGEKTLSYFSQMVGLAFHNFVSAAAGLGVAAALVRGIARQTSHTLGNFWVDLVRGSLYLLLPLCLLYALFLVSQGSIQNFKPYQTARPLESLAIPRSSPEAEKQGGGDPANPPPTQSLAQGPLASQAAIKMLGTNGGGFMNANAAHPYENPTPLANFIQVLSILLIPSGLTWYLGRSVNNQRHGWAVWSAMAILLLAGILACWRSETAGNPHLISLGLDPAGGNMEGKEVRFGIFGSALFAAVTTGASCGAVNSMHDSFTPLGGLVPLLNIQLGEVIFGGVGAGLYSMLLFVVLTVFLAGLMVGRTPEYLGKKIEAYDVKASVLAVLIPCISILALTSWAAVSAWGVSRLNNAGPHGLSELLYAFSSATGNNGSAFAGLSADTFRFNATLAIAMLIGRFLVILPVLALAGNLAKKKLTPPHVGSFPVSGLTFVVLLVGTVLIVGALTFLPVLALGPIVEHFLLMGSGRFF